MSLVIIEYPDLEKLITNSVEDAVRKLQLNLVKPQKDEDHLLQIDEVAKRLNLSKSTIHSYKRSGVLSFRRIGRRIFFLESEVLKSLKKVN